jgi:hypothetical protein
MADNKHDHRQSEPFAEGVHAAENVEIAAEALHGAWKVTSGEATLGKEALHVGGFVALTAFAAKSFGVTATAEDKLPPGHGEGPNHSTSVPASDPTDPTKVPVDESSSPHGPQMSPAPAVSSQDPLMSQEPQHSQDHQNSQDPQQSQDPAPSNSHDYQSSQEPQMSQAPEVSTHNPDVAPDPGYHHY